jgi:glycosidase
MVWSDLTYEDETTHPFGQPRRHDSVAQDTELFAVYRDLVALRKANLRLFVDGSLTWLVVDDGRGLLAYERAFGEERAIVGFNASEEMQEFATDAENGSWRVAFPSDETGGGPGNVTDGSLVAELPPLAAGVWIRE